MKRLVDVGAAVIPGAARVASAVEGALGPIAALGVRASRHRRGRRRGRLVRVRLRLRLS